MSPKEKAKELYDKYMNLQLHTFYTDTENDIVIHPIDFTVGSAKQCVLLAVDEVLLALDGNVSLFEGRDSGYWRKVKSEIEKL